jgi:uncharacterized membrane protein
MHTEILLLRALHIVGGVLWVGAVVFISFFLLPAMKQAGPAAGAVMQGLAQRKIFTVVPIIAIITMLSGIRLMMIVSGGMVTSYFWSTGGRWYFLSGIVVLIAFLVGIIVGRPATMKAAKLSQMATSAENEREQLMGEVRELQAKAALAMRITAILLLIGALGMSLARYL